jgi:hypothetical protein
MPEHFHLLIREPRVAKLSWAMQVVKQPVSVRCRGKKRKKANPMRLWDAAVPPAFWQPRYYDFNVFTQRKFKKDYGTVSTKGTRQLSSTIVHEYFAG